MEYETEPQMPPRQERTWPTRVTGSCLIFVALVLVASLLSYNHGEMGWDFLNPTGGTKAEEAPCTNWLGLPGLYLAGLSNWMLGAASLYAWALLIIFSIGLVIWPRRPYALQLAAMFCLVIFASAIFALQPWFLSGWQRAHTLYSVGGLLGYLDGCCVVEPLIGTRWSLVLFLLLHATASQSQGADGKGNFLVVFNAADARLVADYINGRGPANASVQRCRDTPLCMYHRKFHRLSIFHHIPELPL